MNKDDVKKYEEKAYAKKLAKDIKNTEKVLTYIEKRLKKGQASFFISCDRHIIQYNRIEKSFDMIEQSLDNVEMSIHETFTVIGPAYYVHTSGACEYCNPYEEINLFND